MERMLSRLGFMALAAIAVTAFLLTSQVDVVLGQACQGDIQGLITQCEAYVMKGSLLPPIGSQGCCAAIKTVDIPCACQHVTKLVEAVVDMGKVVKVARSCGIPVPEGTKCGSYTVPPESA